MPLFSGDSRDPAWRPAHNADRFQIWDRAPGEYWDQVRAVLEEWFSRMDAEGQNDVRGRFASRTNSQADGALVEIYVHECLLRMGYAVTSHPALTNVSRRIDFLAEKEGERLYVEATSKHLSTAAAGAAARVDDVYDALDKVESPDFYLHVELYERGGSSLPTKPLRAVVRKWLAKLNPDDFEPDTPLADLPFLPFAEDAVDDGKHPWRINIWASPKNPAQRGTPGVRSLSSSGDRATGKPENRDAKKIRQALERKGSAYGEFDAPHIVVVAMDSMTLSEGDAFSALFGITSPADTPLSDPTHLETRGRKPDGYWGDGEPWKHPGVSAVLVLDKLHPGRLAVQRHTLWHHPDPTYPVPDLPMWRRARINSKGRSTFTDPKRTHGSWFGLDEPWPPGDPWPRATGPKAVKSGMSEEGFREYR